MFYQILLSPQVKQWAIITYKHGIYALLNELLNDVTAQSPWQNESFLSTSRRFLKNRSQTPPTRHENQSQSGHPGHPAPIKAPTSSHAPQSKPSHTTMRTPPPITHGQPGHPNHANLCTIPRVKRPPMPHAATRFKEALLLNVHLSSFVDSVLAKLTNTCPKLTKNKFD